jgi:hypothetical protein
MPTTKHVILCGCCFLLAPPRWCFTLSCQTAVCVWKLSKSLGGCCCCLRFHMCVRLACQPASPCWLVVVAGTPCRVHACCNNGLAGWLSWLANASRFVRMLAATMDSLGFEPRAPRMLSRCDTTTPRALETASSIFSLIQGLCVSNSFIIASSGRQQWPHAA